MADKIMTPSWENDIAVYKGREMPVTKLTGSQLDELYEKHVVNLSMYSNRIDISDGVLNMCEREYERRGSTIPDIQGRGISIRKKNRYADVKVNIPTLSPTELQQIAKLVAEQIEVKQEQF